MERNVRHLGAKLDQRHAEITLVFAEAGQGRRHRRGDDRLYAEVRRADDIVDVAKRRRVGGDHVDVDAQPVGVETDRVLHALDPVDRVERRMRVERDLPVTVDCVLAAGKELLDVGLLDLVTAELDLDIGDVAGKAARSEARPDVIDGQAGHSLGELNRLADRMLARLHVGNETALDSSALALPGAEHLQAAVVGQRADQRPDLRGADIERCNQGLVSRRSHVRDQPSAGC